MNGPEFALVRVFVHVDDLPDHTFNALLLALPRGNTQQEVSRKQVPRAHEKTGGMKNEEP